MKNYWVFKFTVNGTNLRMNIWYNKAEMEKQTYYEYMVFDICSVSLNVVKKKCSNLYCIQIMIEFLGKHNFLLV